MVSKPLKYEDSLALLRSCLDQLEKIAMQKLPGATKTPPPVPPKPILPQKPTLPPRPKKPIELKRLRGNSVSFADEPKSILIPDKKPVETVSNEIEDDDDEDDDDATIVIENSKC